MTIVSGDLTIFEKLMMAVHTTVYSNSGDTKSRNLNNPDISQDSYVRRHVIASGSFEIGYPNTSYSSDIMKTGEIWPVDGVKETNNFTITALKDGSSYHCIAASCKFQQIDGKTVENKIEHDEVALTKDNPFTATVGKIYIPTVDFTLNGDLKKSFTVIACSNNDATIIPSADGSVGIFYLTTVSI